MVGRSRERRALLTCRRGFMPRCRMFDRCEILESGHKPLLQFGFFPSREIENLSNGFSLVRWRVVCPPSAALEDASPPIIRLTVSLEGAEACFFRLPLFRPVHFALHQHTGCADSFSACPLPEPHPIFPLLNSWSPSSVRCRRRPRCWRVCRRCSPIPIQISVMFRRSSVWMQP